MEKNIKEVESIEILEITELKESFKKYLIKTKTAEYTKEVREILENEKKVKIEIYRGEAWEYIRETLNGNFMKASFTVNGKEIKLKVPSKKQIAEALKEKLNIDIKLK